MSFKGQPEIPLIRCFWLPLFFALEALVAVLKNCVVINDEVYCWDSVSRQYVKAKLEADKTANVPDEAIKAICMKMFNLKEITDE